MSTRPRVVATDLDGTLLRTDGTLSARTREAIAAAERSGIVTVFVTGRPPRWLDELADAVGAHGVAICGNGAFVYDVAARRVTEARTFERGAVADIVGDLRALYPTVKVAVETADGPASERDFLRTLEVLGRPTTLDELVALDAGKLLARADDVADAEFLAAVADIVRGRAELAVSERTGLAEMSAVGVTKASGLAAWCQERDFTAADVWAFGDMPNDLPMLGWAGRAHAVSNAHPDVLEIASHVIGSNDEDAVAGVLESLLSTETQGAP